jgi:hypothetical protein
MDMGEGYIDPGLDMDGDGAPPPPPGDMAGGEDGGMGALGDALGGAADAGPAAPMPDAADAAIGAAMDGAMDQGGAPADDPGQMIDAPADDPGQMVDTDPEPDPSAGMG